MRPFKNTQFSIVFFWAFIFMLLTIISFVAAAAKEEGTSGDGFFTNILAEAFWFFRFPTHTLFWNFFENSTLFPVLFFGGWVVNSFLYGLVIERLIYFLKRR